MYVNVYIYIYTIYIYMYTFNIYEKLSVFQCFKVKRTTNYKLIRKMNKQIKLIKMGKLILCQSKLVLK